MTILLVNTADDSRLNEIKQKMLKYPIKESEYKDVIVLLLYLFFGESLG